MIDACKRYRKHTFISHEYIMDDFGIMLGSLESRWFIMIFTNSS